MCGIAGIYKINSINSSDVELLSYIVLFNKSAKNLKCLIITIHKSYWADIISPKIFFVV
jgi:hypothetical protein